MNSLLIYAKEVQDDGRVIIRGERARAIRERFALKKPVTLKAGVLDGRRGSIAIETIDATHILGTLSLTEEALPRANALWIIAIPRPQMVKRILFFGASLGINEIHFVRSEHTQKSYFQSKVLEENAIHDQLIKGVEQSGDTVLPEVSVHAFFKPFLEECLPGIQTRYPSLTAVVGDTEKAIPYTSLDVSEKSTLALAIGPERGWNAFERQSFLECGFQAVSLGNRIYQVDHALTLLHSGLASLRESNTR